MLAHTVSQWLRYTSSRHGFFMGDMPETSELNIKATLTRTNLHKLVTTSFTTSTMLTQGTLLSR